MITNQLQKLLKVNRGFTLVELAVVMIIIGLLIGGLLRANIMITNARLKKVVVSVDIYRTAARTFEDKYGSLPGDLVSPSTRIPGCSAMAECIDAGNGDGYVGTPRVSDWSVNDQSDVGTEPTQFWIQLALSDLIDGVNIVSGPVWGGYYPVSPLDGGFQIVHAQETPPNKADGHYFVLRMSVSGSPHPSAAGDAVLSPERAMFLDSEFDDGRPSSGAIIAENANDSCWNTASGVYNVGKNGFAYWHLNF
jgi:prepilin-type N-terminal cleavage/methylation domain-containing protein